MIKGNSKPLVKSTFLAARVTITAILLVCSTSSIAQLPANLILSYTLKLGGAKLGTVVKQLSLEGDTYQSTSETRAEGLASILLGGDLLESCSFVFDDLKVVSHDYSSSKTGRGAYQNDTHFDWENRTLSFGPEEEITLDMPAGYIVDGCNMPFAATMSKGQISADEPFYIVDGISRRIRGYTVLGISNETINTAIGELRTVKIELQRLDNPDRTLTLWLAEDKQYVLVRTVEKRPSRTTVMEIDSIDGI